MSVYGQRGAVAATGVNTAVSYGFGAVFVLVGVVGFLFSGGHPPIGQDGGHMLGVFEVNVAHNVVHIAGGAILITAAVLGARHARIANAVFGLGYLAVFGFGLYVLGRSANVFALNGADNMLHLAFGLALISVGLFADRR